jgi:hypothetical protein
MSRHRGRPDRQHVAKSDDPYALSLLTGQPGKVVALNVGISQIHFGIYDTKDSGADVHGIVDNADPSRGLHHRDGGYPESRRRARPSPSPSCSR